MMAEGQVQKAKQAITAQSDVAQFPHDPGWYEVIRTEGAEAAAQTLACTPPAWTGGRLVVTCGAGEG
jgi:hypothetical protein